MKNRNTKFTTILFVLAFALAPIVQARPGPSPGPTYPPANEHLTPDGENLPVITIYSTGDVARGKTGSFVLDMKPPIRFGGTYINFSVSGTAISGVDYVPLVPPAYVGSSGYGVILVKTLPDPRAIGQAYEVIVTLEPGLGYFLGEPKSAKMTIKP